MRGGSGELVVENEAGRMSCPYCKGCQTVLNGTRKGRQGYLCKDCRKQWREGGAIGGRSFPPDQIGAAIQMYYAGLSFRQAAKALKDQFGIQHADVSPETVRKWVDRYTDAAIRLAWGLKTPGGGMWWVFRTFTLNPSRDWQMVLDHCTGYILGNSVMGFTENEGTVDGFTEALFSAVKHVDEILLLMMQPEFDWRSLSGSEVIYMSRGEAKWNGERWGWPMEPIDHFPPGFAVPKIFREYHQACARFEWNNDTGKVRRRLAGWVITRNLFTKQRELGGRTPGQAAGIESPIAAWADVVKLEARAFLPAVGPKAAVATRLMSKDPWERG